MILHKAYSVKKSIVFSINKAGLIGYLQAKKRRKRRRRGGKGEGKKLLSIPALYMKINSKIIDLKVKL